MRGNEEAHVRGILAFYGIDGYDIRLADKVGKTHFRSGATDEWRSFFSDDFLGLIDKDLPTDITDRFGWLRSS